MKHLKSYSQNESVLRQHNEEDVKKIIKDTFVNLEDDSFNLVISKGIKMIIDNDNDDDQIKLKDIFSEELFDSIKKNKIKFFDISNRVDIFKTRKHFIFTNDFFDDLHQGIDYLNGIGISLQFIRAKFTNCRKPSFFKDIDDISHNYKIGDVCENFELFFSKKEINESITIKNKSREILSSDVILSDNTDSILNNIHDICLELSDIGFDIEIEKCYHWDLNHIYKMNSFEIVIINHNTFTIKKIRDTLDRLIEYMKDNNYNLMSDNFLQKISRYRTDYELRKYLTIEFIENMGEAQRRLKKYNEEFNKKSDLDEVKQIVKDICLELTDEGLNVEIEDNIQGGIYLFDINIIGAASRRYKFDYSEVEDVIERLKDYIQSSGYYVIYRKEFDITDSLIGIRMVVSSSNI